MSTPEELKLWKDSITPAERIHHEILFYSQGPVDGYLSGDRARDLFLHSKLPLTVLSQIWNIADVSNDNVLSVEEFVLAMHLILKVKEGLPVLRSLPKHLVPSEVPSPEVAHMSDREREAYQNVFNKVSQDQINAVQGRLLMSESQLPVEELSYVWDLSDVNRDGQLDRHEWNVTCHLIRHLKKGGKLDGPFNVFELIPKYLSSVSYLARKQRVEEYNKKKHHLMTAKEKRKSQIDSEQRRLELLKKRFALHKELFECSKSLDDPTIPEEDYNLYKQKEENNIEKVEAIIYRLKKEHESIRQQTVKAILDEKGGLQEDAKLIKQEQEDVRQKLAVYHTKATKDPDPFHQLYELRRDLRKKSNLSEGEEPEVQYPFQSNPFNKESLTPKFSGHSIFISPDPSVFNNNNSHKETSVLKDLCGFGVKFLDKWAPLDQKSQTWNSDPDYDPIFMVIRVPMDPHNWSGIAWCEQGSRNKNIESIHQKLVDLKLEIDKLSEDAGGQLLFRKPEDYLARQKAQEEEDRFDKSKYQRRFGSDKKSDKDVTKRRSYITPRTADDEAQRAAREYRQKRRSLNLDKRSDLSDKSESKGIARPQKSNKQPGFDSPQKELKVSTETTDSFTPESASSPRSTKSPDTGSGPISPRSATSPPRPSTKRKAAPPPPCARTGSGSISASNSVPVTELSPPPPCSPSGSSSGSTSYSAPSAKLAPPPPCSPTGSSSGTTEASSVDSAKVSSSVEPLNSQPKSPQSKIPKPVSNQEPLNSKPCTPQVTAPGLDKSSTVVESSTPNRPPRRKKKSEENRSFLHDSFEKEQKKSKEIAVNVNTEGNVSESPYVNVPQSDLPEPDSCPSFNGNQNSSLDVVTKDHLEIKSKTKVDANVPVNGFKGETIVANVDSNVECEIQPQKINKARGKFNQAEVNSSIEFKEREYTKTEVNVIDSDDEPDLVVTAGERKNSDSKNSVAIESNDYMDHIQPTLCYKKSDDLRLAFERIEKTKDTKDTISIASDISISSAGSEAPPLPDSAPPPLLSPAGSTSLSASLNDVSGVIESDQMNKVETSPAMADVMPEITEKASPREVTSPISELKASMFSMRVTSPTTEMDGTKTNGQLTIDTGNEDSDMSDDETVTGTFTPGEKVTKDVPMATSEDNGEIQLISYNPKLNSPNSDSAFEDMQSSMTSNDHLSNTYDELSPSEDCITTEMVEKAERTPKKEVRSFVLEFDTDAPKKPSGALSPTGNKNFMMKAQQFADTVQRPPKMTVKLKREINTPQDISDERYLQLEAERRAVISSSTMKKKDLVTLPSPDEEEPVEQPPSPDPDNAIQEWRSEVSKRGNILWEEKPDKVNLYSENIIQETENTDTVDRESIANLSSVREKWEVKFQGKDKNNTALKKQTNQQVRHWEVKLPTQLKKVPADVIRSTKVDSDSESENMAEVENSNESAIEREIRLAMEREQLLKKEQEERANLQTRQMASMKKEFENNSSEQNNNKPTYHEMTEADRDSELQQREKLIQQELQQQEQREAAVRGTTRMDEESSHSSEGEDENANESIIEREIRLQQERERELEMRRQQLSSSNIQNDDDDEEVVVTEEIVTLQYKTPVHAPPSVEDDTPASTMDDTPVSTPDDLSEVEEQAVAAPDLKTRISYEEAIASASHEGESLIARELREAREREEELKKQRESMGSIKLNKPTPAPEKQQAVKEPVKVVESQTPSYQKDVSPFKKDRRQSTDSLSSGQSNDKSLNAQTKSVRVAFGGGATLTYRTPEKPKDVKRQETPIEREIRLARERENEFRVSKGLPPLKDEMKVDYETPVQSDKEEIQVTNTSFFSNNTNQKKDANVQKFASSRLQKEINKQTALEKKYREEGKIISTSEDHVGLIKYSDIAQQEHTTPTKRNFSIPRKSASSEPLVAQKQNGTPEPEATPQPKGPTPEGSTPKFNRSISTGNVTFSYKESRHKAESKIEQELREMREREEELRNQREGAGLVSPRSPRSPTSTSVVNKRSQFEQTS